MFVYKNCCWQGAIATNPLQDTAKKSSFTFSQYFTQQKNKKTCLSSDIVIIFPLILRTITAAQMAGGAYAARLPYIVSYLSPHF